MSNTPLSTKTYGTGLVTPQEVVEDYDKVREGGFRWKDQPIWYPHELEVGETARTDRKILITALMDEQSPPELQDIGYALLQCERIDPCKSPLCNYCRSKLQTTYQARAVKKFAAFEKKDIYFLTLLDDLTYTPLATIPPWITNQRSVLNEVLGYHFGDKVSVYGGFEVDVKDPSMFRDTANLALLKEYGLVNQANPAWMPHFHAIVGLEGITEDEFRRKMRSRFAKKKQVTLSPLWPNQTKDEAIRSLTRYCFKFKYRYTVNLGSDDKSHEGTTANYQKRFSDDVMRTYTELLHIIKGSRTVEGLVYQKSIRKP